SGHHHVHALTPFSSLSTDDHKRLCCKNEGAMVNSSLFGAEEFFMMKNASSFKWRHFEAEIILLCIRWYLRYSLSYRDLEEMMLERGLHVDHTTIYRWVQHS